MIKNNLKEWLQILGGLLSLIGSIYGFITIWNGNQDIVLWILMCLGTSIIVAILFFVGFHTTQIENKLELPKRLKRNIKTHTYPSLYKWARALLVFFLIAK